MAEQLKRLSRPDHEEAQRLIGLLTDGSSTVSKVNEYLETLTAYQQRVVAQLHAPNPEQAERIEKISAEIQALREAAAESVPKADLERVTAELSRVQKEVEETGARQQEEIERLNEDLIVAQSDENPRVAELKGQLEQLGKARQEAVGSLEEMSPEATVPKATFEEAQRAIRELEEQIVPLRADLEKASGEENPLVVELKKQIAELERVQEETGLKHQEALQALKDEFQRLTVAAEDHPREIEDITRRAAGEAEKAAALQLEMRGYQEVAVEVSCLPHDQAATKLEEAQRAHDAIEGKTPQDEANKAFLAHKIALLETKQAEHLAIQKDLVAARQTAVEEALRSPELALERQSDILRAMQEQMRMDADILTTARAELGDVESEGPDKKLQALELDRQVAQLASQLQMLETLQKTLQGFEEIGRGQAGLGLTDLHRVTSEALGAAREEYQRLDAIKDGTRDESAIAVQAEKVSVLEAQVEQLHVAVESYQKHAATQVAADAKFLQQLITLIPSNVPGNQVFAYIYRAVEAIAAIQQTLTPEFRAEGVHHSRIKKLLEKIYEWNQDYLGSLNGSVQVVLKGVVIDRHVQSLLGLELPKVLQTIVEYTQMPAANIEGEITAKRAAIAQLNTDFEPLDAVYDHTRDEIRIEQNRAQVAIENIYLNTLLAIQGVHQPLHDAKADLEWQKSVLGTMQRLIFGFFSMLFSIPGMIIGGLQTMGHPLVSKK